MMRLHAVFQVIHILNMVNVPLCVHQADVIHIAGATAAIANASM
jgi:hypothetical protein